MFYFFTAVHIILCVFMIFVILLQPGKDAGMGAALGGGAATTAFGGRGAATFLTKLTAFCAIAFFITSLGLSFVGLKSSVADSIAEEAAALPSTPPSTVPVNAAPKGDEAVPSTAKEAAPVAPAADPAPSAKDAVPAEKLPE